MKKVLVLLVTVLAFNLSSSQNKFRMPTESEPYLANQYVVLEIKGSVEDNYKKVLDYVNRSYNTPSEVIKSSTENKYIRIQGNSDIVIHKKLVPITHHLEFHFKQDKIKITLLSLHTSTNVEITTHSQYSKLYKSNGKPKKAFIKYSNDLVTGVNVLVDRFETGLVIEDSTNDDW